MQDLGLPSDMPEAIEMPLRLKEVTFPFWNWFHNDIMGHPLGVQRNGDWHAAPDVQALQGFGSLGYQWRSTDGISWLTLWTGSGHKRTRTAITGKDIPPFSLLTRCWFDLCLDMAIIDERDWEDATAQLERFKVYERREYGQCW